MWAGPRENDNVFLSSRMGSFTSAFEENLLLTIRLCNPAWHMMEEWLEIRGRKGKEER